MDPTGEDEWSDWEDEETPVQSLLESKVLPSAKDALQYDKDANGFDLLAIQTKLGLDFYGCVKLVNFVRSEVAGANASYSAAAIANGDFKAAASAIEDAVLASEGAVFADERYLRPTLQDDALLLSLEELIFDEGDGEGAGGDTVDSDDDGQDTGRRLKLSGPNSSKEGGARGGKESQQDVPLEYTGHTADNDRTAVDVGAATRTPASDANANDERPGREGGSCAPGEAFAGAIGGSSIESSEGDLTALREENARLREALETAEARMVRANQVVRRLADEGGGEQDGDEDDSVAGVDNDSYYFRGYAHWGVHETMLTDTVRTGGYERAICDNASFFKGKVVLDVGCGTGVLSCFAARAGASKVIGVDRSDIVIKAREVVRDNGFDDVVTLVQGKVEDVDIGVTKVDVIISEWMGYCLFYESMLPSVLFARNKYLAKGGVVLPDRTPLFIQGWKDPDGRLEFWGNVHGLDYSSMADLPLEEASVEVVGRDDMVTERCLCQDFNIETVADEDLDFEAPFEMTVTSSGPVSGLVVSFDTGFFAASDPPPSPATRDRKNDTPDADAGANASANKTFSSSSDRGTGCSTGLNRGSESGDKERPIASWFSTGPESRPTHWKQTLLWLRPSERPEALEKGDGIAGRLALHRNEVNPRELGLTVTWTATQQSTGRTYGGTQKYIVC